MTSYHGTPHPGGTIGLVVATSLEAEPFVRQSMRDAERLLVAGKRWHVGHVGTRSGSAEPEQKSADTEGCPRAVLAISGYDKTNASQATTSLIERFAPDILVNFGIAGAFPGAGLGLRDLVLPIEEVYGDTGASSPQGWLSTKVFGTPLARVGDTEYWNSFPLDTDLVGCAERILRGSTWDDEDRSSGSNEGPEIAVGTCLTMSLVTGRRAEALELEARFGAIAESMEGASCAHVCTLFGVPFVEVRAISNMVGHRDRAAWDLEGAAARAARAAATLCDHFDELRAAVRGAPPVTADMPGSAPWAVEA
jgi:futalosine hydrolase